MSYTVDLVTAPDTATVGEPMDVVLEVCCTSSSGCGDDTVSMTLDNITIFETGVSYVAAFCIDAFKPGGDVASTWPDWLRVDGQQRLIIDQPGTYTLSWPGGSKQITVEPEPFDPAKVTRSCTIVAPDDPSPGDSITLEAEVSNANSESADVELTFSFGDATQTATATVTANGSTTVSRTFTADTAATYDPDVSLTVL